jgi:hypothetical protein
MNRAIGDVLLLRGGANCVDLESYRRFIGTGERRP